MTERGHVNHLDISITRTRWGKTRARLVGRAHGVTVDVTVTGWRRTSVLAEAHTTFEAASSDPTRLLEGPR